MVLHQQLTTGMPHNSECSSCSLSSVPIILHTYIQRAAWWHRNLPIILADHLPCSPTSTSANIIVTACSIFDYQLAAFIQPRTSQCSKQLPHIGRCHRQRSNTMRESVPLLENLKAYPSSQKDYSSFHNILAVFQTLPKCSLRERRSS